jgi:bifunctional non-homologous end joining protein LigD
MERLHAYRRKRDFERTSEPSGRAAPADGEGRFVIQKHAARRLHYDLRLEQGGVLRSWALPKGPSLETGERRLAVEVEDHPIEYADFEGTIPKGEYGAGTVMLWDRGRWSPVGEGDRGGRIDFVLDGVKLRGRWTMTRMGGRGDDEKNWLMIRRSDGDEEPRELDDTSVLTGRTMDEIAAGAQPASAPRTALADDQAAAALGEAAPARAGAAAAAAEPAAAARATAAVGSSALDPSALDGARRAALGRDLEVQLATLVREAPEGEVWIHEIKFDGYRVVARLEDGRVTLFTRSRLDWTERFPEIAAALRGLRARSALIDGEVVAVGRGGATSFAGLQEALKAGETSRLRYQAFDLLHLDGHDLRAVAQVERKRALAALLAEADAALARRVRYTEHIEGQGPAFRERACAMGLEGIISKRRDAPYRAGRGRRWLKIKCPRREIFAVGGFTPPNGSRSGFGSLLLGCIRGGTLEYAGRVGSGFSDRQLQALHDALAPLRRAEPPFEGSVPDSRDATWVEPELSVEVRFTERTADGRLRHPTFIGVAHDGAGTGGGAGEGRAGADSGGAGDGGAGDGGADPADSAGSASSAKRGADSGPVPQRGQRPRGPGSARRGKDDAEVAGVRLTNASRVLYPEQGITKLDLARYYVGVEEQVLASLAGRPLALVRCPQGRAATCFYQKHPGEAFPRELPRVPIQESAGMREYAYVETIADLVGLVQVGVLEVHAWGSRVDDVERPDMMVIDLDPAPDVPWSTTCATALALRDRLHALELAAYVRTTGGKGLHVVVPLVPRHGWDEVKAFAKALCARHAAGQDHLVTTATKAKRQGRIYLDYLRNGRGATAIASYSTRARPGAPVAVPIRWDELNARLRPDKYHVGNVRRRLSSLDADPWQGLAEGARSITASMLEAVRA